MARHRGNDKAAPVPVTRRALHEARQLAGYLWPYRGRFAAAMAFLGLSSLLTLALPYLAGSLIDSALPAQTAPRVLPWHGNINAVALTLVAVLAVQAVSSF